MYFLTITLYICIILAIILTVTYYVLILWQKYQFAKLEIQSKKAIVIAQHLNTELVHPVNGVLPVPRSEVRSVGWMEERLALMERHIQTQMPVQNVPHTYAPKFATDREQRFIERTDHPLLPVTTQPALDFYSLWNTGKLPFNKFLLGFRLDNNEPIYADWEMLYSSLVGGESGSGKSTLLRLILAQSILQGGKFVVIDPHFLAGEESLGASLMPLRNHMMCDIACEDKDILAALGYMNRLIDNRKKGKSNDKTPVILIADELTALLTRSNVSAQLEYTLGYIAHESRKMGIFAVCTGQQWQGDIISPKVRNSFVSVLSCPSRRQTAKVLSDDLEFAKLTANLKVGEAAWKSRLNGIVTFSVPNTTQQHIALLSDNINHKPEINHKSYTVVDPPKIGKNSVSEKVIYPEEIMVYSEPESDLFSPKINQDNYYTNGNEQNTNGNKPQSGEINQSDLQNKPLNQENKPENKPPDLVLYENNLPNASTEQSDNFSAKELQIMEMLENGGYKMKEIVIAVYGEGCSGGKPYNDAVAEIMQLNSRITKLYKQSRK
jgi:energy-coupling factor transporter ATP-binding protein EcfA2